jgi:hypothetical protein
MPGLQNEFQAQKFSLIFFWKRPNGNPLFCLTTWSEMLMPQRWIFFRIQTSCRIDGLPPEQILSTTVFTHLLWKWNGRMATLYLSWYTETEMSMPQRRIFFRMQTSCMIDGRPPEWIFSTKVLTHLPWKRLNWNLLFFLLPGARAVPTETLF